MQIRHWVTYSILCKDEPRRRAAIMKHFILIADVSFFSCSLSAYVHSTVAVSGYPEFFDNDGDRHRTELFCNPSPQTLMGTS